MKANFGDFVKRVNLQEMRGLQLKQFIRKYEADIQELLKKSGEEVSIKEGQPIPQEQANSIKINILFEIQLERMAKYGKESTQKIQSVLSEDIEEEKEIKLTQGTLF